MEQNRKEQLAKFKKLWNEFGNIAINDNDEILTAFLQFESGTDRFDIWHWFEKEFDVVLGDFLSGSLTY